MVAGLADPARRQETALSLATSLGAEDLLIFTLDPEIGVLLPAPGFPQTLPEGAPWTTFLSACLADGEAAADGLPCPYNKVPRQAYGVAASGVAVLVLLGGTPNRSDVAEIRLLLPLLTAAFRGERAAGTAQAQAAVAQEAASQARALAEALDRARRDLGKALSEAQSVRQRFAQFMQHLPGLAWIKDREGRYVYANDAVLKAFGTAREQLYEKSDKEVFPPRVAAQFHENDSRAVESGTGAQGIESLEYADGTVHHCVVSRFAIPGTEGAAAMLGGMAIDITKRKQAEDALRKQNERLRLLSEAAADLLAADNPEAMIRDLFERVGIHLGADAYFHFAISDTGDALILTSYAGITEEVARPITRLEFGQAICGTTAQQRGPVSAAHNQVSDALRPQLVKSSGVRAYTCQPLMAGQQLLGTLSYASRTKDTFTDDELEFVQTVCHYVAAAYERGRLISRLREADRRKDEFLATLAHELRNPLAPISNAVELIGMAKHDAAQIEELRQMMGRQVKQMVRLIDDLMDASRISRGKLTLRTERVVLATIVQAAVESVCPQVEDSDQELMIDQADEPLTVEADPMRLTQVLVNLLNNASKYSPPGRRIWLSTECEDDRAVIRVRDAGQGIPSDRLSAIFDIFYQVDRSAQLGRSGLGIGLTLVKSLVEMHGGSIEAHSEGLGRGSEFIVRLPLATAAVEQVSGQSPPSEWQATPSFRILVVEDSKVVADLFARLLRGMGQEVRIAPDGPTALDVVGEYRPDIVFSDISMPRMSGYDLARRLRKLPELKDTVLVATTGYGQAEDRRQALEAGFDYHLVKPAQTEALQELFARVANSRG